MKKEIIGICFQCECEDVILENENICPNCDRMNRENDFKSGEIVITKDNIHLYYEFMSDEDLKEYAGIINTELQFRSSQVIEFLKIDGIDFSLHTYDKAHKDYVIRNTIFGVKDTLKPIDEYIKEIKASSEYEEYISTK